MANKIEASAKKAAATPAKSAKKASVTPAKSAKKAAVTPAKSPARPPAKPAAKPATRPAKKSASTAAPTTTRAQAPITKPRKTPAKAAAGKVAPVVAAPATEIAGSGATKPADKASVPTKAAKSAPTKAAAAKMAAAQAPATAPAAVTNKAAPPLRKAVPAAPAVTLAPVKGETKDGIKFTKDFDAKFLTSQYALLVEARVSLTGQAVRLEDEANSLIDDEMGDVQFDDESGEGDTMVVERERDLFLSARARQDIDEIDGALKRLTTGAYGYSVVSFKPIPRERLEAIPWATELTEEKVGGIGRR